MKPSQIPKENYEKLAEEVTRRLDNALELLLGKEEYGNIRKNCNWSQRYQTSRYGDHYIWALLYEDKNNSTSMHPLRMCVDREIMFVYTDETGEHIANNIEDAIEKYIMPFKEKERKFKRFLSHLFF